MMNTIKLAIVLPCYNEEEIMHDSAKQLTSLLDKMISDDIVNKESFIVFVNDGSKDRTWTIIKELSNSTWH